MLEAKGTGDRCYGVGNSMRGKPQKKSTLTYRAAHTQTRTKKTLKKNVSKDVDPPGRQCGFVPLLVLSLPTRFAYSSRPGALSSVADGMYTKNRQLRCAICGEPSCRGPGFVFFGLALPRS